MYNYGWFMLRADRKQQNSVKQLSFNKKIKKKILNLYLIICYHVKTMNKMMKQET